MTSFFQETSLHFINQISKCLNRIIATHQSFYININDNLGAGRRPQNYFLDGWAWDQPAAITIELEITWYLHCRFSNIKWHKRKQGRLGTWERSFCCVELLRELHWWYYSNLVPLFNSDTGDLGWVKIETLASSKIFSNEKYQAVCVWSINWGLHFSLLDPRGATVMSLTLGIDANKTW